MYLWALIRLMKNKEDPKRIKERFAQIDFARPAGKLIWIHAASVGETLAILSLVIKLAEDKELNILLTTYTLSSSKIVAEKFPNNVIHQFLPYDSPCFARKLVKHWQPQLVIWTESDFWPNILTEISRHSKLILLNERMSDKSFERWKRFSGFARYILGLFEVILPQSTVDYKKMEYFGAKNLDYLGNLKYSLNTANLNRELVGEVGQYLKMRTVIFIASTHPGEELMILKGLKKIIDNQPQALIFLAPRHPVRTEEVKALLTELGFRFQQRTVTTKIEDGTQVYLIDTMGEMNNFYKLSHITIMGGSFVDIGGHNIIEPAKFENLIICGPYMSNFKQALDELISAKALIQVREAEELGNILDKLLKNRDEIVGYAHNAHKLASSYDEILAKTVNFINDRLKS